MKDIRIAIIFCLCGIIAGMALLLKKQQDLQMVLALSHRELENWLAEGKKSARLFGADIAAPAGQISPQITVDLEL